MGIDATISDELPRERFERITYAYADEVNLEDMLGDAPPKVAAAEISEEQILVLADKIRAAIKEQPLYFAELAEQFSSDGFQSVARALGRIHKAEELWQDKVGKFCLANSEFAANPPQTKS
jgi:2,5-furandicarboxylate decarboxylase 1